MKLPRASMTTTLFVILVFAVAFAVARDVLLHDRGRLSTYVLGLLPMAMALTFGLYRIARLGARSGAFTAGFEVAGLVAAGSHLAAIRLVPAFRDAMSALSQSMDNRLLSAFPGVWEFDVLGLDELVVLMVMLSVPSLLAAIAGGLLARKLADRADRPRGRAPVRPRFTLATVAMLVAVVAVDLALLRRVLTGGGNFWSTFAFGFLPLANALALGLPRMLRGRRSRFLIGFEVAGWLAIGAYLSACAVDPVAMIGRLGVFDRGVLAALDLAVGGGRAHKFLTGSVLAGLAFDLGVVAAFFSLPPLAVALSGGALTRRIGHRSPRPA